MTGIDGVTVARPQDRAQPLTGPLPDVMTAFSAEYFVEWQVEENGALRRPAAAEK